MSQVSLTSDSLVSTKARGEAALPTSDVPAVLIESLKSEPGRRLTLITAPAGFGKTTLLGEWMAERSDERSVAWASLDEGDNDPARFLSYLVAALRSIEERIGEGVLSSFGAPGSPPVGMLTGALLNELADIPGELAIVLDDYHLIDSDRVHGVVSLLLDRLPSNVQLVAGRRA